MAPEESFRLFKQLAPQLLEVLDSGNEIIMILDENFNVGYANQGAIEFFAKGDLVGVPIKQLLPSINEKNIKDTITQNIPYSSFQTYQTSLERKTLFLRIYPLHAQEGTYYLLIGNDTTSCHEIIELYEIAFKNDSLTGFLTPLVFLEEARRLLLAKPHYSALMLIDLYNFTGINITYGRETGDEVLKEFAYRLRKAFEEVVLIARANDEFMIFIPQLDHRTKILQYIDYIRLLFEIPLSLKGELININFNLGISIYPLDGRSPEELLEKAKLALRVAKEKGPNSVEFFSETLANYLYRQVQAEKIIQEAFEKRWFTFFIQPYFSLKKINHGHLEANSQSFLENYQAILAGGEALARIVKPTGEVIPPGEFITELERSIYLEKFEKFAFEEITRLINTLKIPLGLNLYPATFYNKNFWFDREKKLASLEADLVLEIIERAMVENINAAKEIITWLKQFPKVKIALDDFGTGYSNLSILKNLPIDILKIDGSFIKLLESKEEKDKRIVKTIIDLAHSLDAKALAEFVETQRQVEFLVENGCDYLQGFLFSKPLSISDFKSKYLHNGSSSEA